MSRQWRIIKLIETHANGIGAAELAEEIGVPIRMLDRDLMPQRGGLSCFGYKYGKSSYWKMVDTFQETASITPHSHCFKFAH